MALPLLHFRSGPCLQARIFLIAVCLGKGTLLAGVAHCATTSQKTAEEILRDADHASAAARWVEAAALYGQFLENFASSPEVVGVLDRVRLECARSLVKAGNFSQALGLIQTALHCLQSSQGTAPVPTDQREQHRKSLLRKSLLYWQGIAWLKTGDALSAAKNFEYLQLPLLRFEALLSAGDTLAAFAILTKNAWRDATKEPRFQLLVLHLARNFLEKQEGESALRCLRFLLPLQHMAGAAERSVPDPMADFEETVLLYRAEAFRLCGRHREAALAWEAVEKPEALLRAIFEWQKAEDPAQTRRTARRLLARFPRCENSEFAVLAEATACEELGDFASGLKILRTHLSTINQSKAAASACCIEATLLMRMGKDAEAVQVLEESLPRGGSLPSGGDKTVEKSARILQAVALSNLQEYHRCRSKMTEFLGLYPQGSERSQAHYHRAAAAFKMRDFPTALQELEQHLKQFPHSQEEAAVLLMCGDILLDQGKIEEGLAAFARISPVDSPWYTMAVFRKAKVLRRLGRLEDLKCTMECFRREHPESPRLAEAVRQMGWVHRQQGHPHLATRAYWKALEEWGNRPQALGLEGMLEELQRDALAQGKEEIEAYRQRLAALIEELRKKPSPQPTWELRLVWAQSRLQKTLCLRGQAPAHGEGSPNADALLSAEALLSKASEGVAPRQIPPRVLADIGDAFLALHQPSRAAEAYQNLLRWHPTAQECDRALAGRARLVMRAGKIEAGKELWEQLLKKMPESPVVPEALLTLARAIKAEKSSSSPLALQRLEEVLTHGSASVPQKAEALFLIGDSHLQAGNYPKAIAYFQRVYVAYSREAPWVARAYLLSAQAFQALGDLESAKRTCKEFLSREDLRPCPEFAQAAQLLKKFSPPSTAPHVPQGMVL